MKPKSSPISTQTILGRVIRTTGSHCTVMGEDGKLVECTVRGKFRLEKGGILSTNPVAVGDWVFYSLPKNSETGVVEEIKPRHNYLIRKAVLHAKKVHILCANIDQAVLIFTIKSPKTSFGFANRFLAIAEAYHIPILILVNKIDLLETEEEKKQLQEVIKCYEKAGYPVYPMSLKAEQAPMPLLPLFENKVSFLGGHSGAGKSTLLNKLNPNFQLKTQEISGFNDKGMHTTTHSEMYAAGSGYIIDAPGIKEMGLVDIDKSEVGHYFPEIRTFMGECKFNNCTHINEPSCAVKEAVKAGEIHLTRYESYKRLYFSQEEEGDTGF